MYVPEQVKSEGYLSAHTAKNIETVRGENADWFNLILDVSSTLMEIAVAATNTVKGRSMSAEAIMVRILLRSCGTLQGVILLTERGMVSEGRTLARSLVENALCAAALHDRSEEFIGMLKDDSEASRRQQAKFIIAQQMIASGATRDKLQIAIEGTKKAELMSPKKIATLGPLVKHYLAYQRLSDDSAHTSARSLHRYMNVSNDRSGWSYRWVVGDKTENAVTLHQTLLAAFAIGVAVTRFLKDEDGNSKLGKLLARFETLPTPPVL